MKKLFLLDGGHGGVIAGEYQTAGKRSPKYPNTPIMYEGEFNRHINVGIAFELSKLNIAYVLLAPEDKDITINTRVLRANKWMNKGFDPYLISTHSNAGGGEGFECFTSVGKTRSDKLAQIFYDKFQEEFPSRKIRVDYSDGDIDKEKDFGIIKRTLMPAVLNEWFFMDNQEELQSILLSEVGRTKIICANVEAIKEIVRRF